MPDQSNIEELKSAVEEIQRKLAEAESKSAAVLQLQKLQARATSSQMMAPAWSCTSCDSGSCNG